MQPMMTDNLAVRHFPYFCTGSGIIQTLIQMSRFSQRSTPHATILRNLSPARHTAATDIPLFTTHDAIGTRHTSHGVQDIRENEVWVDTVRKAVEKFISCGLRGAQDSAVHLKTEGPLHKVYFEKASFQRDAALEGDER